MKIVKENIGLSSKFITKVKAQKSILKEDVFIIESPLEISLEFGKRYSRIVQNIALTMRTPGNDNLLAIGFLFAEGIITTLKDILGFEKNAVDENKLLVKLSENVEFDINKLSRHLFTSSSCGVCGKTSIENIVPIKNAVKSNATFKVNTELIYALKNKMFEHQNLFSTTGGNHAAALFNEKGALLNLQEDVGRHNALDKLIGFAIKNNFTPLNNKIILLSGRLSFELVQKAVAANCEILIAIGAPSNLAIEIAVKNNLTLIGFLKENSFNIYCHKQRIDL